MDKGAIAEVIASNIKKLMHQIGLSSTELAKKCQLSDGTVSKIIHGSTTISVLTLIALSEGLGVPIAEILGSIVDSKDAKNGKKLINSKKDLIHAGILSINHKRLTHIKDFQGNTIGSSDLAGDLDLAESPPSILQIIKESIIDGLANVPKHKNINFKRVTLTVVLQSYEFEETRERFENLAKKFFHSVKILPDWKITYLAAFKKTPGLSLVTDKGVSLSYMQNGVLKKLGGWKFPVYDLGGENWLGSMAVKHTIEAFENFVPMTKLATSILADYGGKIEQITEACFKSQRDPDVFCRFADTLLRCYFTGDEAAKNIVQQGFDLVYQLVEKADSILQTKLKIALNGSLKDIYKDFFTRGDRLKPPSNDEQKVALLADLIRDETLDI